MEAFEHVVKVYLEAEGYVVTSGVKFPITRATRRTNKRGNQQEQTHGYEVDIVAARGDSLILGSVKSFFGSAGVNRQGFPAIANKTKRTHFPRYRMFNEEDVREGIIAGASELYGYSVDQIGMCLFVGKFRACDESMVCQHLATIKTSGRPIRVVGLKRIADRLLEVARHKRYLNDPVVVTLKVLAAAGLLRGVDEDVASDEFDDEAE